MSIEDDVRLMKKSNDELLEEFGLNYQCCTEYGRKVRQELMRRLKFGYHGRIEDLRGAVEHKTLVNADQENKIEKMKVLLWKGIELWERTALFKSSPEVFLPEAGEWVKRAEDFLVEQK
jgi:hypothetical protein